MELLVARRAAEIRPPAEGPSAPSGPTSRVRSSLLYLWKVRGSVVKEGERLFLDAMRKGDRPMTTLDIVGAVVADLGYGDDAAMGRETATWKLSR